MTLKRVELREWKFLTRLFLLIKVNGIAYFSQCSDLVVNSGIILYVWYKIIYIIYNYWFLFLSIAYYISGLLDSSTITFQGTT